MRETPIQFFEDNFGPMTPFQMQNLLDWMDDFNNDDVIRLALEETALKNPSSPFKFLERILVDWHRRKLFTPEDVLKEKQKFQSKIVPFGRNKEDVNWDELEKEVLNG